MILDAITAVEFTHMHIVGYARIHVQKLRGPSIVP